MLVLPGNSSSEVLATYNPTPHSPVGVDGRLFMDATATATITSEASSLAKSPSSPATRRHWRSRPSPANLLRRLHPILAHLHT